MKGIAALRRVQRKKGIEKAADLNDFERLPFFESAYGSSVKK